MKDVTRRELVNTGKVADINRGRPPTAFLPGGQRAAETVTAVSFNAAKFSERGSCEIKAQEDKSLFLS